MTHNAQLGVKIDKITGREYFICLDCKQIIIPSDPYQNTYCPMNKEKTEIEDMRERLK